MSPEDMRDLVKLAMKHIRDHAAHEHTDWNGESFNGMDILEDLSRAESTLYLLCDSRKVRPLSQVPAGFEAMALPRRV